MQIRKRGKDPKIKPILLNKEDPSCVSDPSSVPVPADTTIVNHFEEMHPKDEFELMHSTLAADKVSSLHVFDINVDILLSSFCNCLS